MKSQRPRMFRSGSAITLSLGAHAALLALLLIAAEHARLRVVAPQRHCCPVAIEVAGAAPQAKILVPEPPAAKHNPEPYPSPKLAHPAHAAKVSGRPEAPKRDTAGSGAAETGMGSDAEDATPAFPVFSPKPPVTDRSLLPASEQKIVVDVKLNDAGEVVDESLIKGLGNRLDLAAMQIVKTWRFQPATLNGKPVASEAEVIFPFNRSYPVSEP